jgi:hypothetical protein
MSTYFLSDFLAFFPVLLGICITSLLHTIMSIYCWYSIFQPFCANKSLVRRGYVSCYVCLLKSRWLRTMLFYFEFLCFVPFSCFVLVSMYYVVPNLLPHNVSKFCYCKRLNFPPHNVLFLTYGFIFSIYI